LLEVSPTRTYGQEKAKRFAGRLGVKDFLMPPTDGFKPVKLIDKINKLINE